MARGCAWERVGEDCAVGGVLAAKERGRKGWRVEQGGSVAQSVIVAHEEGLSVAQSVIVASPDSSLQIAMERRLRRCLEGLPAQRLAPRPLYGGALAEARSAVSWNFVSSFPVVTPHGKYIEKKWTSVLRSLFIFRGRGKESYCLLLRPPALSYTKFFFIISNSRN